MQIIEYEDRYKDQIIDLILTIQNKEAGIGLSLEEQPDLCDIQNAYINDGGDFWVAVNEQGDAVGTIGLMNKGNGYGILKKFFVRSDYRSHKVGLQLYQALQKFCKDNHFKVIILDTPSVAETSHHFYERNGFSRIAKNELPIAYDYPDRDSYLYLKRLEA